MSLIHSAKQFTNFLIVASILLLLTSPVSAQFFPAKLYTIRDGMPTNAIYDIAQGKNRRMWFVTAKGVANYDALNWRLFPDSLGLPNSPYSFIKSTSDGTVWVAGQNNEKFVIQHHQNGLWSTLEIAGLPDIRARFSFDVITDDKGHHLVISSENMTYRYYTATKELKTVQVSSKNDFNINASKLRNNKSYLCSSEGLFVLDSEIEEHPINEQISNKEILQIFWKNNELYVLGIGWLGSYKNGKFQYLSTETGIENSSQYNKHNLSVDQFDRIFYSSNSAAKYLDRKSALGKTLYVNGRRFNALSNRIYVDVENNVWVGDHRGLFKFNVLQFKNYNKNTGLADDEVSAILEYEDMMILANPKYLNFLKDGSVIEKLSIGKESTTRVLDLARGSEGSIYIAGSRSGLLVYDGNRVRNMNWKKGVSETGVTSLEFLNEDLYFTSNTSVYSLKKDKIKHEINIPGLRNLQRLNGDTLAALSTSRGILFYNPTKGDTTRYISSNRSYNNVYSVVKWRQELYMATAGGLALIKKGEINPILFDSKMNRVAIYSLLIDKNDKLWMGTNEGAFIWDGNILTNYNQSYGLVGDEVNRNAFVQDKTGNIWIGTENGVSEYSASDDFSLKIIPKLHLNNTITQKGTILTETVQDLDHDDNTIEFNFIGISFFDEQQITYRYKLNGFDTDWLYIDNPNSNSVRYTNLPAGDFEFTVQSGLASANWSNPVNIKFQILKPFYYTNWFILLVLLITISTLYMIFRLRFYIILKNQKKLEREVRVRTHEIHEMNEEIQAQNEELKQQSEEIYSTNENLEKIVQERTIQLREQNKKLSEYAFINSHELRAPICRMLGLLNLLPITDKTEHPNIFNLITNTGIELDQISKEINLMLDTVDLTEFEESNSIEVINAQNKLKDLKDIENND